MRVLQLQTRRSCSPTPRPWSASGASSCASCASSRRTIPACGRRTTPRTFTVSGSRPADPGARARDEVVARQPPGTTRRRTAVARLGARARPRPGRPARAPGGRGRVPRGRREVGQAAARRARPRTDVSSQGARKGTRFRALSAAARSVRHDDREPRRVEMQSSLRDVAAAEFSGSRERPRSSRPYRPTTSCMRSASGQSAPATRPSSWRARSSGRTSRLSRRCRTWSGSTRTRSSRSRGSATASAREPRSPPAG